MRKIVMISLFYSISVFAAALTLFSFLTIVTDVMIKGIPNIDPALFSTTYNSEKFSIFPACLNTVFMVAFVMIISIPVSVLTAVYLSEYSGNLLFCKIINAAVQTLASIPSIIFGVFGYLCFTVTMKMGLSFISGALTMSLMIWPIMISSTQAALAAVPNSIREGGRALGAVKARVSLRLIVPAAKKGIISGAVLSVGKIVGETAALIYTLGSSAETVSGMLSSGRTIAIHIYAMCCEGLYTDKAYAVSAILIMIVSAVNIIAFRSRREDK